MAATTTTYKVTLGGKVGDTALTEVVRNMPSATRGTVFTFFHDFLSHFQKTLADIQYGPLNEETTQVMLEGTIAGVQAMKFEAAVPTSVASAAQTTLGTLLTDIQADLASMGGTADA